MIVVGSGRPAAARDRVSGLCHPELGRSGCSQIHGAQRHDFLREQEG